MMWPKAIHVDLEQFIFKIILTKLPCLTPLPTLNGAEKCIVPSHYYKKLAIPVSQQVYNVPRHGIAARNIAVNSLKCSTQSNAFLTSSAAAYTVLARSLK